MKTFRICICTCRPYNVQIGIFPFQNFFECSYAGCSNGGLGQGGRRKVTCCGPDDLLRHLGSIWSVSSLQAFNLLIDTTSSLLPVSMVKWGVGMFSTL